MSTVYRICIPNTHRDYFDYSADHLSPCIGERVWVPFRKQRRLGVVVGHSNDTPSNISLKSIEARVDESPIITADLLDLAFWISGYYQSPLSEVMPLFLPKKYREGMPCSLPMVDSYQLIMPIENALGLISSRAKKQRELLDFLVEQNTPMTKQALKQNGFNTNQIQSLVDLQILKVTQTVQFPMQINQHTSSALALNDEQKHAVECITEHLGRFKSFVLQGVTGSGKTEVYLQVIARLMGAMDPADKPQGVGSSQILVIVPEIGLTPQLLARFTERFAEPIAVLHSNLNETERQVAWQLAKDNQVRIVIGTRSAVFTPMPNLGLIIIDEEHDSSLKQMEGVRYSARDTALMRAHLANIPIVMGSATPSLESLHNCQLQKHQLLRLNQKALSTNPLRYQVLDLRSQTLQQGLASETIQIIEQHLANDNQVLIFINRRGFAPVLLCHQCGWMVDCKACDSHLTMHKQLGRMICHHCGLSQKTPFYCSRCKSNELIPVGTGTQRIFEFLQQRFPNTSMVRIDRDEVSKKNALNEQLDKINKGEAQLIVGTQMLAKGHHFPRLTLVVVVDADAGFYNQDFRAIETLGQLLIQVSGRAGRAEHAGQVLIQTHIPHHPMLNTLVQQGYDAFAQELLAAREQAELPPYHYMAIIRAQGKESSKVFQFLQATKDQIRLHPLTVMGPAPAPLPRKAHQHRMQLLIKSPTRKALKSSLTQLREWLTINTLSNGVRWNVDVDPLDLS